MPSSQTYVSEIPQLVFDVRNDAKAMWYHYKIHLQGVYDLQLLEQTVRSSRGVDARVLAGLKATLQGRVTLPRDWEKVKQDGKKLYASKSGGSGEIWDDRPLHPSLIKYAAQDVALLFPLQESLENELSDTGKAKRIAKILEDSSIRCRNDLSHWK